MPQTTMSLYLLSRGNNIIFQVDYLQKPHAKDDTKKPVFAALLCRWQITKTVASLTGITTTVSLKFICGISDRVKRAASVSIPFKSILKLDVLNPETCLYFTGQ